MSARTPLELDHLFVERLNAADLDGLVALYEPQATLTGSPGSTVTGHAAIREVIAGFLAGKPRMTGAPRVIAQTGDVALLTTSWEPALPSPAGKPAQMRGSSAEVA